MKEFLLRMTVLNKVLFAVSALIFIYFITSSYLGQVRMASYLSNSNQIRAELGRTHLELSSPKMKTPQTKDAYNRSFVDKGVSESLNDERQKNMEFEKKKFENKYSLLKENIVSCGLKDAKNERLTCYDGIASLIRPELKAKWKSSIGSWKINETTSKVGTSLIVDISTFSNTSMVDERGKSRSPRLYLRCESNKPMIFVDWKFDLGKGDNNVRVTSRFDLGKPTSETWLVAENNSMTILNRSPFQFIEELQKHKKLDMSVKSRFFETSLNADFFLEGLDNALDSFSAQCPDTRNDLEAY